MVQSRIALVVLKKSVSFQFQKFLHSYFVTKDSSKHQWCPQLLLGASVDIYLIIRQNPNDLNVTVTATDSRQMNTILTLICKRSTWVYGVQILIGHSPFDSLDIPLIAGLQKLLFFFLKLRQILFPNMLQ